MASRASQVVSGTWRGRPARFHAQRIIVSVRKGTPPQTALEIFRALLRDIPDAEIATHRAGARWALIRLNSLTDPGREIPQIAERLGIHPELRYAEPDFALKTIGWPDDPLHNEATHWWPDMIEMPAAWAAFESWRAAADPATIAKVLIAVFDTGISISAGDKSDHEDLSDGRIVTTHTDSGGNAVSHNYTSSGGAIPKDESSHGTHVTGIAVATADNGIGVAGVNWIAPVYVARVVDSAGGFTGDVKTALVDVLAYATATACDHVVLNLSVETEDTSYAASLMEFCEDAVTAGAIACCGSASRDDGGVMVSSFPSVYAGDFDNVISVGGTDDDDDMRYPIDNVPEITVVAPGASIVSTTPTYDIDYVDPNYDNQSGSSMATPIVSGLVALMWARNANLTPAQIKEILRNTAETITRNGNDYKRVNAARALEGAVALVTLNTPTLVFGDVPEGESRELMIEMTVSFGATLTFEVVPASLTGLPAEFTVSSDAMTYDPTASSAAVSGITVRYTASSAGSVAFHDIKIKCKETGEEWAVYLLANTVGLPNTGLILVLDKSGSMNSASGIFSMTRMDVLKEAAGIVIDAVRAESTVGAVAFAGDASSASAVVTLPSGAGTTERGKVIADVDSLTAEGSTSIGDGVRLGDKTIVDADVDKRALLVLTDGHENTVELIKDVMDEVTASVYAVGMGTAEVIRPAGLTELTVGTGGYVLLTGILDDDNRYKVAKYCLQMLAGITGTSMVVDPVGKLRPRQPIDVAIPITRMDSDVEVFVLSPWKQLVDIDLVDPLGKLISSRKESEPLRSVARWGVHVGVLSAELSKVEPRRRRGIWRARLNVDADRFGAYLNSIDDKDARRRAEIGAPYCVMVTCRSVLRMEVRANAAGTRPGSSFRVTAVIAERGLPSTRLCHVTARVEHPGGYRTDHVLDMTSRGVYEMSMEKCVAGIYTCLVKATGWTSEGDTFAREQIVTAHFWNEPGTAIFAPAVPGPSRVIR